MKSSKDVEKVLERFGGEWPNNGSIVDCVMHEIESDRRLSQFRRIEGGSI